MALFTGFLTAMLAASSGCGSDAAGSCGAFTPCGGNVVGNWSITGSCLNSATSDPSCPGATTNFSGIKLGGTINVTAGLTYATSSTISGTATVTLPNSCLTQGAFTVTCEQLNAFYLVAISDPSSGISAASCRTSGANCACSVTFRPTPTQEQGTYITSGNVITLTPSSGDPPSSNDYCVVGNKMNIKESIAMPGMGMMTPEAVASLTLTRQ